MLELKMMKLVLEKMKGKGKMTWKRLSHYQDRSEWKLEEYGKRDSKDNLKKIKRCSWRKLV